jgi:hypothetical protein
VILVINHFKSRIREFRKIFITIRTRIVSEKVVFDRDIVFSPTVFRGELETDEIVTYFVLFRPGLNPRLFLFSIADKARTKLPCCS